MADLLLLFTADKKPAAAQLAEAAAAAGYPSRLEEVAASDGSVLLSRARAGPTLLLWSRSLAGAAVAEGWLAGLRQLPNLIEVSTDGIAPDTGEVGRVVLLSGWRGQPYHLGWQQIVERLGRIAPAGPRPLPAPPPERAASGPAEPGAVRQPTGKTPRFALPALGLAALIAAVATWNGSRSPAPAPIDPPRPPSAAAAMPAPATMPAPVSAPAPPAVLSSPRPVSEESRAPAEPVRGPQARPAPESRKRVSAAPGPGPVKRYSRRNSKTMRLFCARSGRGTPQCRTFARSMRALGR
jgi:hypothetical protein